MILQVVVIAIFARIPHAISENLCSVACFPNPAVKIRDGCVCGTAMPGLDGDAFEAFLGIPYAKPPVNELRFTVSARTSIR